MDTAKAFKPHTILLWQKVARHPEARRIVDLFPSADVKLIEHQRIRPSQNISMGQALHRGKRALMIGQTTSFVGHFNGQLGSSVRCCPYYKLVPISNGCPYYCTYCYLAFVYRKFTPFIKININYNAMFRQIRKALARSRDKISFNMGEMLDSLALDHITNLTAKLVPFFANIPNAHLMLLTKSSNIDNLLIAEPNDHIVVSWSLNSQHVINSYELGTASLLQRIEAAKACQKHGYRVRFRIDPGIVYPDWQNGYVNLIRLALNTVQPENITLGMLRLLPGHKRLAIDTYGNRAKELAAQKLVETFSDGKMRFISKQRVEFYNLLVDTIRSIDKNVSISLCRETPDVWQALKGRCKPHKCNCVSW